MSSYLFAIRSKAISSTVGLISIILQIWGLSSSLTITVKHQHPLSLTFREDHFFIKTLCFLVMANISGQLTKFDLKWWGKQITNNLTEKVVTMSHLQPDFPFWFEAQSQNKTF